MQGAARAPRALPPKGAPHLPAPRRGWGVLPGGMPGPRWQSRSPGPGGLLPSSSSSSSAEGAQSVGAALGGSSLGQLLCCARCQDLQRFPARATSGDGHLWHRHSTLRSCWGPWRLRLCVVAPVQAVRLGPSEPRAGTPWGGSGGSQTIPQPPRAAGPPEHGGKDNPGSSRSSSRSSLAWSPNTQPPGIHAETPGPARRSARGLQNRVPSATRCHPWLGQLRPESPSASDSPQIKAFPGQGAQQTPWNGQSCPGMAGMAAASPGPAADPNQKAGNLTALPTPSYPGNTRKGHGANASRRHRQHGLGNGDTRGVLNRSRSTRADQGTPGPPAWDPPAQSQLREPQASIPILGEGSNHHAPPLQTSKRLQSSFSHSFLVPVRAPALEPGGLFLSRAIQAGKKKKSLAGGRCPRGDLASEGRGGITG